MAPIDDAIAAIEALKPGEKLVYQKIADQFGVDRSTLARRHKRVQVPRETKDYNQQKLTQQQEEELVQYIEELTARYIPPTREMIANFASTVAQEPVSESWVTRFINKYSIHLISQFSTGMDSDRHNADSYTKYELYFNLLQRKIAEYKVDAEHTYNMDEKGFMIGVTSRTKHVFSRRMWEKKEVTASLQDGNRAWVTLIACVCGDRSALPPGLLYESTNNTIQSSWIEEIKPGVHNVLVSSSPSGWTNNEVALAWLQQVFDRFTKAKARRKYRLLILDGHGSHVTMDFINYCDQNKILLAVLPPHSTHTLQPLDVVMFKPLSTAYSKQLTTHLHNSQGLSPIKKSDFFHLFWKAWTSTFTQELILRSFETTGISPLQPNVILQRFAKDTPEASDGSTSSSSVYSGKDWLKIETLLRKVVRDESSKELRKISRSLHHISVQNQLLHHENQGLKEVLKTQKKHRNKSKALQFQPRNEYHGGAEFYSPSRVEKARSDERTKQQNQKAEELRKAEMAKLRHANKLYNEKIAQERREQRAREKEERERVRAEKAEEAAERKAQRERDKQARGAEKAIQLPQRGKRKAPQSAAPRKKQNRGAVAAQRGVVAAEPPAAPRTHTTRSGRTATLYN
jgi:hypothetical protein